MAIKVSNLAIKLQSGTTNTLYASWEFNTSSSTTTTTSTSIKKGDIVKIKSGAKWYNGAAISDSSIFNDQWKVYSVKGSRVVLNTNASGTRTGLMSPIDASNLTVVNGSGSNSGSSTTTKVSNLDYYEVKYKKNDDLLTLLIKYFTFSAK